MFKPARSELVVHMNSSHRAALSTKVQYLRRRKSALWMTVSLLALALLVLTVGLISATRTDNVPVAGYYPGIIVSPSHLHKPSLLLKLSPIKVPLKADGFVFLLSGRPAEFRSLSGNCWNPPGGKSKTNGESDSTTPSE